MTVLSFYIASDGKVKSVSGGVTRASRVVVSFTTSERGEGVDREKVAPG